MCAMHGEPTPIVRRITRGEHSTLRTIRLRALKEDPSAFGSTFDAEVARPDEEWAERARLSAEGTDRATFIAIVDDRVVGLAGGYRPDHDAGCIELVSMWTAPEARRRGLGRALVQAVIDWAAGSQATVVLWVTRGNDPAHALYVSMGFHETGECKPLPSDPRKDEIRMALAR
jgi:GNAT superfamily N-acetyltransferase